MKILLLYNNKIIKNYYKNRYKNKRYQKLSFYYKNKV